MVTPSPALDGRDGIRVASFSILLQELHYYGGDRLPQLETVIATYIIYARVVDVVSKWGWSFPFFCADVVSQTGNRWMMTSLKPVNCCLRQTIRTHWILFTTH